MPDPNIGHIVKKENKLDSKSEANSKKAAYRRLAKNADFKIFYDYLEMCYNSYMDQSGSPEITQDTRTFLQNQANMLFKILQHLKRQQN